MLAVLTWICAHFTAPESRIRVTSLVSVGLLRLKVSATSVSAHSMCELWQRLHVERNFRHLNENPLTER